MAALRDRVHYGSYVGVLLLGSTLALVAGLVAGENLAALLTILVPVCLLIIPMMSLPAATVVELFLGRFEIPPYLVSSYAPATLLGVGILLSLLAARPRMVHPKGPAALGMFALIGLSASILVGTTAPDANEYGREKATLLAAAIIVYIAVAFLYFYDYKNMLRFEHVLVAAILLAGVVSLLSALRTTSLMDLQRVSLPGGGPITLARYAGLGAIGAWGLAIVMERARIGMLFTGGFLTVLCFITGSRGPSLFLLVTLALIPLFLLWTRGTRRAAIWAIGGMIAAAIGVLLAWPLLIGLDVPFLNRFLLLLQDDKGSAVENRAARYPVSLDLMRDRLWTGSGTGSWEHMTSGMHQIYPHNLFLETGVEQGLIGLVILFVFICSVAAAALRVFRTADAGRAELVLNMVLFLQFIFSLLVAQTSGDVFDNRLVFFFGTFVLAFSQTFRDQTRKYVPNHASGIPQRRLGSHQRQSGVLVMNVGGNRWPSDQSLADREKDGP